MSLPPQVTVPDACENPTNLVGWMSLRSEPPPAACLPQPAAPRSGAWPLPLASPPALPSPPAVPRASFTWESALSQGLALWVVWGLTAALCPHCLAHFPKPQPHLWGPFSPLPYFLTPSWACPCPSSLRSPQSSN